MSLLFVLIVLFGAIAGFFLNEILAVLKWFFAIPGTKLVVPLLFASFVVEVYSLWEWKGLFTVRSALSNLERWIAGGLPFQTGALYITRVLLLVLLAIIPLALAKWIKGKNPFSKAFYWGSMLSACLWLLAVILLITSPI